MLSANHWRLAASALAVTIALSAPAAAQSLAMDEPGFNGPGFPFLPPPPFLAPPPFFPQAERAPAPQPYQQPYQERSYPQQSYQSYQSYPSQAAPDNSVAEQPAGVADERFRRQVVAFNSNEAPGTIIIDTPNTYLYYVLGGGRAIRYGIGVGREGFTWAGTQTVARKQEWPDWHPPAEMLARQPYLPRMMAGGPGNPLGARAMYLGNTEYRIHGTNAPDTIGKRVSSGCIRLTNADVEDLFDRVTVGTKVVVLPMHGYHPDVAQTPRPAPVRQNVSMTSSDAPRPMAAIPNTPRPSLAYSSPAWRLY
jgi:lipoprotein-anchoring transpeptidase ErfK/SrfK